MPQRIVSILSLHQKGRSPLLKSDRPQLSPTLRACNSELRYSSPHSSSVWVKGDSTNSPQRSCADAGREW
ncbi:MAG: hypothetical protein HC899_32255 [Leptolyngbyaceae cyanobacterium SM1_4_3]|nr:hypothetical protein [Leptolyngbyaceae cyanobacterium SM1_4_3]NJN90979.1 hypothetical protein [Leptolyngbyaceae cyanobacterium SL_5_14]